GAVEPLPLIAVCEYRERTVTLETTDPMTALFVDRQTPLLVERQSVGAGLQVLGDVGRIVAALVAKHRKHTALRVLIDRVVVWIAEQKNIPVAHPHWSFGEQKTLGHLEQFGIGWDDGIDRWIGAPHSHVHLMRFDGYRRFTARNELEPCLADE